MLYDFGSYCFCPAGYTGERCQTRELESLPLHISWCIHHCKEDASCNTQLDQFIREHGILTDSGGQQKSMQYSYTGCSVIMQQTHSSKPKSQHYSIHCTRVTVWLYALCMHIQRTVLDRVTCLVKENRINGVNMTELSRAEGVIVSTCTCLIGNTSMQDCPLSTIYILMCGFVGI